MWPFQVKAGETAKQYLLQAKLTNLASATVPDDPPGHVTHLGASFQLRGKCGIVVGNTSNCAHLAWLEGSFDVARDTVRIELPLSQSYAPEVIPGATLEPFSYAGGTVAAAYQAAVSNATVTDFGDWTEETPYVVPQPAVRLGVAPAGTDPANVNYKTAAELAAEGSFSGTVSTTGLAPGSYEVFARGCFADNCGVRKASFTV
jgi:hypothetical protein